MTAGVMYVLYHLTLSPFCRKVRIALGEKRIKAECRLVEAPLHRPEFLALNPAGEVPVLEDGQGLVLADSQAIVEYLDEVVPTPPLLGEDPVLRAETRRLAAWFDVKFHREVSLNIVYEKLVRSPRARKPPAARTVRAGFVNLRNHLDYIDYLTERRRWLAGDEFSLADISAAAHISCVDYLGDVPWSDHAQAREWYARAKSRPSFLPLLRDRVPGRLAAPHYANPDF